MNIACGNCPAKYAVPDDKVRGRKVRITCKRCGAGIVVDGTTLLNAPAEAAPAQARQRHSTKVGGLEAPVDSSRAAPVAAPAPEDEPWTVAVTDDDQREMTLADIVRAYEAGTIDAETFIWRDGMDDWLTPFEIPAIEAALRARGLAPRTSTPPEPPVPEPPRPKDQSGAWREPGRWDASGAAASVSFDDVTVAMAAPKAQALLEAVTATGAAADGLAPAIGDTEESTVVADSRRFGVDASEDLPKERPAPRPAAGTPAAVADIPKPKAFSFARPDADADGTTRPVGVAARAAARRAEKEEIDLFARNTAAEDQAPRDRMPSAPDAPRARMPSVADGPRARMPSTPPDAGGQAGMTGARNETSVLFTLDQLTKPAKAKPAPKAEKIDADALLAPSPSIKLEEEGPPSVAKIGGGGLFASAAMAAPDFNAPAAPSAPSHPPPSASAQAAPVQERSGGGSMLWVVLGALGVVGAGTASYFFMVRSPEAPPATEGAATATAPVAAPVTTPQATTVETPTAASAAASANVAASSMPSAAAPSAAPSVAALPATTAPATAAPTAPALAPVATAAPAATPGATAMPKPTATAQPKPQASAAEAPPAPAEGPAFDKDAAAQALGAAATQAQTECASQDGPHGSGKVTVTFVNSGRATNALVSGDFAGSALGGCVARVFRGAKVPPFGGDSVRVTKGVHIP